MHCKCSFDAHFVLNLPDLDGTPDMLSPEPGPQASRQNRFERTAHPGLNYHHDMCHSNGEAYRVEGSEERGPGWADVEANICRSERGGMDGNVDGNHTNGKHHFWTNDAHHYAQQHLQVRLKS